MMYDMTLCAACGKKGAHARCMRCLQAAYCDKSCQKVHWRAGHKRECKTTTDAAAPTPATVKDACVAHTAAHQSPGDHPPAPIACVEATDACQPGADTRSSTATNEGQEDDEQECPICMDNPDTFAGLGPDKGSAQCYQCGQQVCGPCKKLLVDGGECPTCRASFRVSHKEEFRRLFELVHTRSPGRHTPAAQYNLGCMYQTGIGVAQDLQETVRLWALAAAQGHVNAQYCLGVMYQQGTDVYQDYHEAARLFALAATQGDADAQSNLGIMHQNGMGVPQDYHEAVRLYALAAAQGHAAGQHNLGCTYRHGMGVAQDFNEAVRLYTLAAAKGHGDAQLSLGGMHANGQGGIVPNLAEAATWLRLAAAQGNAEAQSALDRFDTFPINTRGMRVQVFGLTSANGLAANGRHGLVQDQLTKPGRAAVLLDGDTQPTSISTTNLHKAGGL